jgi:hypothetical protein
MRIGHNIGIATACLALGLADSGAVAAELVSHEARYDIVLESIQSEGFPLEAGGVMAVRLTRDCQKWELIQEMQFSVGMEGAAPIELHVQIKMLEGLDGSRMEFTGWQKSNGRDTVKLRGRARMNRNGDGGVAEFSHPEQTAWNLPSPTRLMVSARRDLLEALSAGEAAPQSIAFEIQGVSEVTRVSPGKGVGTTALQTAGAALLKERSWTVDRAIYFEEIAHNEPAMYETLQIHANGVVSKFWHDYRNMVIEGELVALEKLPEPTC